MIRQFFRLLLITCTVPLIFAKNAYSGENSALWFKETDIKIPGHAIAAELHNGVRIVILPTIHRNSGVSARVRVAAGVAHDFNEQLIAQVISRQVTKDTPWTGRAQLTQTTFSLDLNYEQRNTLEQSLKLIKERLKAPYRPKAKNNQPTKALDNQAGEFKDTFYVPGHTTIIVTGGEKKIEQLALLKRVFSDWSSDVKPSLEHSVNLELDQYKRQIVITDTGMSLSTLSNLQEVEDSKLQRREKLMSLLATKLLAKRIANELDPDQTQLKLTVENEILFNGELLSQIKLENLSETLDKTVLKSRVERELKEIYAQGFTLSEYHIVVQETRSQLYEHTQIGGNINYTKEQADRIVRAINQGTVYSTPSYDLDLFNFHVAHMDEIDISKTFRTIWPENLNDFVYYNSTKNQ